MGAGVFLIADDGGTNDSSTLTNPWASSCLAHVSTMPTSISVYFGLDSRAAHLRNVFVLG